MSTRFINILSLMIYLFLKESRELIRIIFYQSLFGRHMSHKPRTYFWSFRLRIIIHSHIAFRILTWTGASRILLSKFKYGIVLHNNLDVVTRFHTSWSLPNVFVSYVFLPITFDFCDRLRVTWSFILIELLISVDRVLDATSGQNVIIISLLKFSSAIRVDTHVSGVKFFTTIVWVRSSWP